MNLKEAKEKVRLNHDVVMGRQRGAFTFVMITAEINGSHFTGCGFAKCNRNMDEYNKEDGYKIALGRAIKDAAKQLMGKENMNTITELESFTQKYGSGLTWVTTLAPLDSNIPAHIY